MQNTTNQLLTISEALVAYPENVGIITQTFEEQKNGENGEKKLFVRNNTDKPHCFVANFM